MTPRPTNIDRLSEEVSRLATIVDRNGESLNEVAKALAVLDQSLKPGTGQESIPTQLALLRHRLDLLEATQAKAWQIRVAIWTASAGIIWDAVRLLLKNQYGG